MNTATLNISFGQPLRAPQALLQHDCLCRQEPGIRALEPPGLATDHFRAGSRNCGFEKYKVKVLTVAQCPYILT
jgi:hypothetical protein